MLTERTVDGWRVLFDVSVVFSCVVETLIQFRNHFDIFFLCKLKGIFDS